jgi:hypothetical protein
MAAASDLEGFLTQTPPQSGKSPRLRSEGSWPYRESGFGPCGQASGMTNLKLFKGEFGNAQVERNAADNAV